MRLKKEVDFGQFLREVNDCTADVLFCTQQEDVLNLKSMLSRYIFASLTMDSAILETATIVCRSEVDELRLAPYLRE